MKLGPITGRAPRVPVAGERCNEHGVYEPDEVLTLDRDAKGWRGLPTAEIELRQLEDGWLWATSYQLMTGDCCGSASPLSMRHGRTAPSKDAAIEAASAHLRARVIHHDSLDARRIIHWLDALRPAQRDLFEIAA